MDRTRRRFLAAAAGGAGAAAVAVVAVTRSGDSDEQATARAGPARSRGATARTTDRFGLGDAGIANFLLTVQRAERDFYERALASGALSRRTESLFREFAQHERAHVARLEHAVAVIGTHTVPAPRVDLPLTTESGFLQLATVLEGLAASACLGQLGAIDTRPLLRDVLAIHTVDARHAAIVNELAGLDPAPDGALAQPVDAASALDKLRPILRR
jgi:hypothetical protein